MSTETQNTHNPINRDPADPLAQGWQDLYPGPSVDPDQTIDFSNPTRIYNQQTGDFNSFDWREFSGHPDADQYESIRELPPTPTFGEYYDHYLEEVDREIPPAPRWQPRPTQDELLAMDPDSPELMARILAHETITELTNLPVTEYVVDADGNRTARSALTSARTLEVGEVCRDVDSRLSYNPDYEQYELDGEPVSYVDRERIRSNADLSTWLLSPKDLAYMKTFQLDRTLGKVGGPYWTTLNEAEANRVAEFADWVNTRFGLSLADDSGAISRETLLGIRRQLIGLSGELAVMIRARGGDTDELINNRIRRMMNAELEDEELSHLPDRRAEEDRLRAEAREEEVRERAAERAEEAVRRDQFAARMLHPGVTNHDRQARHEAMLLAGARRHGSTRAQRREDAQREREERQAYADAELDDDEWAEYMSRRNRFLRVLGRNATLRYLGLAEALPSPEDEVRQLREERADRETHARELEERAERRRRRAAPAEDEEIWWDDDEILNEGPEAEPETFTPRSHRRPSRRAQRRAERERARTEAEAETPTPQEGGESGEAQAAEQEQPRSSRGGHRRARRSLRDVLRDRRERIRNQREASAEAEPEDFPGNNDDTLGTRV